MELKICARSGTQCVLRRAQILWLCLVAGSGAGGRAATREHGGMDDSPGFADLGLRPQLLEALLELGYEEPTPIQVQTVPPLVAGREIGRATSELQSLMRISYAVFCLKQKNYHITQQQ